jgi:hypothetical protein
VRIKGLGLKNTLKSIEKLHAKAGLDRVKDAMPPRAREAVSQILPIEWYPVEVCAALHIAIRETIGGGAWSESQKISREAAKIELFGPYRLMMRAVQYDTIWDRMERMWPQYYDAGEAKWVERGKGNATAEFRGVAGFNEGMWLSIAGRIEILLDRTGARAAIATLKDPSSTHATIEALWVP